jgi:antitoxin (DNA-binding transcriptional repressor) of toxin-antitoxin stability system
MERVNLDDTQETLADIVARVENGETVEIARGETVVARVEFVSHKDEPKKPIDFEQLKRVRDSLPYQHESAGVFMRRLRDEARY